MLEVAEHCGAAGTGTHQGAADTSQALRVNQNKLLTMQPAKSKAVWRMWDLREPVLLSVLSADRTDMLASEA